MTVKQAREIVQTWEDKDLLDVYVDIAIIALLSEKAREVSGHGSN